MPLAALLLPPPPSLPLPLPLSVLLPVPLELFLLPAAAQLSLPAESSAGSRIQAAGAAEHRRCKTYQHAGLASLLFTAACLFTTLQRC
jgi:hypothetical protein